MIVALQARLGPWHPWGIEPHARIQLFRKFAASIYVYGTDTASHGVEPAIPPINTNDGYTLIQRACATRGAMGPPYTVRDPLPYVYNSHRLETKN